MKPSIIRLAFAFITFTIGLTLFSITDWFQVPPQPVTVTTPTVVNPSPRLKESPPLLQAEQPPQGTDLSIVVGIPESPPTFMFRHIMLGEDGKATLDLDVGESIDGQQVMLHFADSAASYRILQRYRTSMSISAEGPHIDLVDWRHYDSPWTPLESVGVNQFRTLRSEQMDYSRFPKTTKAEIMKEVRRRVKTDLADWPELIEWAESCSGPDEGVCFVSVSSIYLRIQKQVGDRWIEIGMVEVPMPMGC